MAELEITQLAQLLKFLEEERRKDKAQLAVLQERLAGQSNEIADLVRRLQDLDGSLRATQAAVAKTQKYDSLLEEYKTELLVRAGRSEEELKKAARESERVRLLEIEAVQRQMGEFHKDLIRINKLEDELPARRAEEKRLSELIQRLQPQIETAAQLMEERTRGVSYLEEGRRQDVKRILTLEQETTTQLKKVDGVSGKLQVLEDVWGKISQRLELLNIRLTEHDREVQDLRSSDFRAQQQIKAFETQMTQYSERVTEYVSIIGKLREQAQINQRGERDLQAFQETLRQRMAEMGEIERLFEDRVKRQFEEFLGEFEKRWARITLKLEESWHEHDRQHAELDKRSDRSEAFSAPLAEKIAELRADHEKMVQALATAVAALVDTNQSTLPPVSVPPASMPEDGVGLPRPVLRIK